MSNVATFRIPGQITFGAGAAETIGTEAKRLGASQAFVLSDPNLQKLGDAHAADGPRHAASSRQSADGSDDWIDVAQESLADDPKLEREPAATTDAKELIGIATATVQSDSWEDLSGPGSIIYAPGAHSFLVRQTDTVQNGLTAFRKCASNSKAI